MTSIGQSSKSLDSFCQHSISLKTKIGLITLYNERYPDWIGQVLMLFEYLQIMSQVILQHNLSYLETEPENKLIMKAVIWISKLVNPSYLLSFEKADSLTSTTLYGIFCLLMLKYILFIHIIYLTYWDLKNDFRLLKIICKVVFIMQGRIMCFLITSFWIRAILSVSIGDFSIHGIDKLAILIVSSMIIAMEYLLSIFIENQFCYVLPTKNFLSSKDSQLQAITLLQKFTMQILQITFKSISLPGFWVFDGLNLIFSFIRNYHFYTIFPLYKFRALLNQGDLLSIVTSLHISFFFQTLMATVEYIQGKDVYFFIALWAIFSVLTIKISREFLKRTMMKLLTEKTDGPPELLVHKVNATKQLRILEKKPGKYSEKYDLTYLLRITENINIKKVFSTGFENFNQDIKFDLNSKKEANILFLQYLEDLASKFPRSSLVKLHISQLCAKDWELYTKAIKIISELTQSKWSKSYLTSSFLLHGIEKAIFARQNSESVDLDISTYMKSQIVINDLRKEILDQIELKTKACKNVTEEIADIEDIFRYSQSIDKSKEKIQKMINLLPQTIPEYYLEPLLLCANYYLILNYSVEDYKKYIGQYAQKLSKYEKYFTDQKLAKENLYQSTNAFFLLSAQKFDHGKVIFCTSTIQDICGNEKKSYQGSHISRIFTPTLQNFYVELFKQVFDVGKKSALNKILKTYLYHKDHYIVEADFYLRVHPYITQNLYLNMIIRPVPSAKEYILLKENGDIEGATKAITEALGIKTSLQTTSSIPITNIKVLSMELFRVNHAFNIIYRNRESENSIKTTSQRDKSNSRIRSIEEDLLASVDYNRALELYKNYNSREQKVKLISTKHVPKKPSNVSLNKRSHYYLCTMTILPYESVFMKLLTLVETPFGEEQDYGVEIIDSLRRKEKNFKVQNIVFEIENQENKGDKDSSGGSENIVCWETENVPELPTKRESNMLNTDENLLPQRSASRSQVMSPLITTRFKNVVNFKQVDSHYSSPSQNNFAQEKIKIHRMLTTNYTTQNSQAINTHRTYYKALTNKSYKRSFNLMCLIFYGVILATLSSQIILKIVTDKTMNDLVLKKNMLKYAQLRSYRAVVMQIVCRGGALQIVGALAVGDLQGAGSDLSEVAVLLENYRKDLASHNQKIINGINSLDDDIKERLFQRDVRIYGSNMDSTDKKDKNITHFQMIDEIAGSVRRFVTLPHLVSIEGYHALNFVVLNTLNDFTSKNSEITNLFVDSVQQQKEIFQTSIFLCIIITPILLVGIAIMLTFIIWKQYLTEKDNMLQFIKVDPLEVEKILVTLKKFKKSLTNEGYFENLNSLNFFKDLIPQSKSLMDVQVAPRIKPQIKVVKYSKTKARYYGYTIKVLLYISILIGIIIWNYISAQTSTHIIYTRQSQLEFANHLSSRVTIHYVSFVELFASNNTNPVEHLEPLKVFIASIEEIKTLQAQTTEKFLEVDSTYDPQIKAIMFDDEGCRRFEGLHLKYCKLLVGKGLPVNLLPLMASFEIQITNKLRDYYNANKTTMGQILAAAYINIGNILPSFDLIATEAQIIGQIIDNNLTASISNAQYQRTLILLIFSFSLVIVGLLIWFQILKKLRESNNDFKKVLQIFSPKIVLANVFLKTFINKNSADHVHDF